MGSLPNLNELHRERAERRALEKERELARERAREREFPRDKELCSREKDRLPIFVHQTQVPRHHQHHRHSLSSRRVLRTRSSGATHHIWDDPMIEHMAAYSPISTRSHRTLPFNILQSSSSTNRRRESINSSIGATSVRRLLTTVRSCRHKIPIHVRAKIIKNVILLIIAHSLTCAVLVPVMGLQGSNSTWFSQDRWVHFGPDIGSVLLSITFIISSGMCLLSTRIIKKFGFIALFITHYSALCLFLSAHLYPSIYTLLPGYIVLGITLGPAWVGKLTMIVSLACKLSCTQHDYNNSSASGGAIENGSEDHKVTCSRDDSIRRLGRWYHAAQDIGIIFGAVLAALILSCATNDVGCFNSIKSENLITLTPQTIINQSVIYEIKINPITTITTKFLQTINKTQTNGKTSANGTTVTIKIPPIITKTIITTTTNSTRKTTTIPITENTKTTTTADEAETIITTNMSNMSTMPLSSLNQEQIITTESNNFLYLDMIDNINHQSERYVDDMFDTNDHGERICGVRSCPVWDYTGGEYNLTDEIMIFQPEIGSITLMGIFTGMGLCALIVTCFLGNLDISLRYDPVRGMADTFIFAGPLAYFIGTEQGYMLSDFTKAYISCSLGPQLVAAALIGMGIMQFIASCTLSMLLRHTKRIVVIAAGFFFHACLLLVLSRWKPSKDDSALFYVIAAAWGVCNSVWETLIFALVTLTHTNHVADVMSPLQGLKFLGLGITFAAHGLLCEGPKILILAILLVISVTPYAILEIRLESQRKTNTPHL